MEHGITYAFKDEQNRLGTHDFSADSLKIAMYDEGSGLTLANTTVYTTTGEFSGIGYTAGGAALTFPAGYPKMNDAAGHNIPIGSMLLFDFDDVTFSTMIGSPRGAMIYNATKGNKAIALLDFGVGINLDGDLTITWPDPDIITAMIKVV